MGQAALRALGVALAAALVPACGGGGGGGGAPVGTPPSVAVTTPAGTQVSDIPVAYTLTDAESNAVSILVEFSLDGGATFSAATAAPGGDGVAGLTSSPAGVAHVFVWASRLDGAGIAGPVTTVQVRITPSDTQAGTPGATGDFTVDNRVAAFRISDLDLRDPHVFVNVPILGCSDVTDTGVLGQPSLNDTIQTQIQTDGDADGNLDWTGLLLFRIPDQTGPGGRLDFMQGISPAPHPPSTADSDPAFVPVVTTYSNVASGPVLSPIGGTLKPYTPAVTSPSGPGFVTATFSWTLTVGPVTVPLQDVQIGASYVGDPATQLSNGLLMGFLSEAVADATMVNLGTGPVPLSSLLPGGTGNCAAHDDRDTGPGGASGWWFYFNFTALPVTYTGR